MENNGLTIVVQIQGLKLNGLEFIAAVGGMPDMPFIQPL
jgi:hypothetical protein